MAKLITLGTPTSTGGKVITASSKMIICGRKVVLIGDIATCNCGKNYCNGQGKIVKGFPRDFKIDGVEPALKGDVVLTTCGTCVLLDDLHSVDLGGVTGQAIQIGRNGAGVEIGEGVQMSINTLPVASNTLAQASNQAVTQSALTSFAGQQAYAFTEKEWDKALEKQAKEYQWDTSNQKNVSIAILTIEEANEYLDLLIKDTHGELSTGKDYTGVGMGLKGAYDVVKELGNWGATAKAVNINGVMNIVVENYKPRYLDLGIRWQEATPQMLKIGYALNTVVGNINFLKGNVFVEFVFSGAVNAVDYMLHDEKTLGEVVGQYSSDFVKGVVASVVAQGITLVAKGVVTFLVATPPTAAVLGFFAISAFGVGLLVSYIDEQYKFTDPMKKEVEKLINEN